MSLEERVSKLENLVKDIENRLSKIENFLNQSIKDREKSTKNSTKKRMSIIDLFIMLKEDGFFDKPRRIGEIAEELKRYGYFYPTSSLTRPLIRSVKKRILGRIKEGGVWCYVKR